jgi:hypothetical protein
MRGYESGGTRATGLQSPASMQTPRPLTREPEATITGPHGLVLRYHAAYTADCFHLERGHFALTRKGIERKARRHLARLQRSRDTQATVIT